jgi:uncharacterized protein (DUF1015 family)
MPSDAPPVPRGLVLRPFRALRFAATPDLASLISPPYDVIDESERSRLEARSSHNAVRLILPREPGDGGGPSELDRYQAAALLLERWQRDGALIRDNTASLYVYELTSGAHVQRGFLGGVELARPEAEVILPHEDTMASPVADRLALLQATRTNLEPIFLVYSGGGASSEALRNAAQQPPLADVTADDGVRHRLWTLDDPEQLAAVADDLLRRRATIADGHHRYATYLRYQEEQYAAGRGAGPWDAGLAFLVDTSSFGPEVHPIHRLVPGLAFRDAVERVQATFRVEPIRAGTDLTAELPRLLAEAGGRGPAFALSDGDDAVLLTDPDLAELRRALPTARSAAWRGLDVSIASYLLIRRCFGLEETEGAVEVDHDLSSVLERARSSDGTAILLNATPVSAVAAVAEAGERMPRKSTLFTPKPATGLVFRPLD